MAMPFLFKHVFIYPLWFWATHPSIITDAHIVTLNKLKNYNVNALIVLGCPTSNNGTPSIAQLVRVRRAEWLHKLKVAKHLITTGGAVKNKYIEAETLRTALVESGVEKENIRIEPNARDTRENLTYSFEIARKEQWKKLLIITDNFHGLHTLGLLKRYFPNVVSQTLILPGLGILTYAQL